MGNKSHNKPHLTTFVTARPETCPGVCVADRLSGFCEAILNVDGICKPDLKCCVSKQLFNGKLPAGKEAGHPLY